MTEGYEVFAKFKSLSYLGASGNLHYHMVAKQMGAPERKWSSCLQSIRDYILTPKHNYE
jgi:hypothetical protein